jgi:hypothetical protein
MNKQSIKVFYRFFYGVAMVEAVSGDGANTWLEIFNTVKDEMSVALDELEDEFRAPFGDES